MDSPHFPVMKNESIQLLNVKPTATYIDCNLGFGGHTGEILAQGGQVYGFDLDQTALDFCAKKFVDHINSGQLHLINDNHKNIDKHINTQVDGILYDLGLSMHQLKTSKKGFSFMDESSLDMRMDEKLGVRAIDLIKALNDKQLAQLIQENGEEPQALRFAKALKAFVAKKSSEPNAKEIGEVIRKASAYPVSKIHPATRTFQALRIAVNNELDNLHDSVSKAIRLLKPKGRLVLITFHSLEDSIAKGLAGSPELITLTDEPLLPGEEEIAVNPASRSAKLRAYEKK